MFHENTWLQDAPRFWNRSRLIKPNFVEKMLCFITDMKYNILVEQFVISKSEIFWTLHQIVIFLKNPIPIDSCEWREVNKGIEQWPMSL